MAPRPAAQKRLARMPASLLAVLAVVGHVEALRSGRSKQGQQAGGPETASLLLISSPSAGKVSYLQLSDLSAVRGTAQPLIDSGLGGPRGLAFDGATGKLYVADPPSRKVLCYPLQARPCTASACQLDFELTVGGQQVVVAENVLTSWVSVDIDGNLYYSDQAAMTVNRIDRSVLDRLSSKVLTSSDLKMVSELELNALTAAASLANGTAAERRARDAVDQRLQASIVALHEADEGPNIGTPAGVVSDGTVAYWANQAQGIAKGSVVAGTASLQAPAGANKTIALSNITDAAYGVASTYNKILFTGGNGSIYSVSKATRATTVVSEAAASPRGLVWDGDNTVYLADMGGNMVYSLASGREGSNQPLQQVAGFPKPFGLSIMRAADLQKLVDVTAAADSAKTSAAWWASWWPL